jgi:hypothetical protein
LLGLESVHNYIGNKEHSQLKIEVFGAEEMTLDVDVVLRTESNRPVPEMLYSSVAGGNAPIINDARLEKRQH